MTTTIAVDFDGILARTMETLWTRKDGWDPQGLVTATYEDGIQQWRDDHLVPADINKARWEYFYTREFTLAAPPIHGANEGLRTLGQAGATFVLISDRPRGEVAWLWDWLDKYDFPMMTVVTAGFDNGVTKQEVVTRFGATVAIDDAPHHIAQYAAMGLTVYGLAYPYNIGAFAATPGAFAHPGWSSMASMIVQNELSNAVLV